MELDDDYAMEVDEESKPAQKAASRKRKSRSGCIDSQTAMRDMSELALDLSRGQSAGSTGCAASLCFDVI